MSGQTIVLHLPDDLYRNLKARAEQTQRTIEAELLDRVASTAPAYDHLSTELESTLESMRLLDDASLWQAAQSRFPSPEAEALEAVHLKRQRVGLSDAEQQQAELLVRQYERAMLVRAEAVALLAERGHDVSRLVAGR